MAETPLPIDVIPLADAVLCMTCNQITRSKNGHCVACGGSAEGIVRVQELLDRSRHVA